MADLKEKLVAPELITLLRIIFNKNPDWFDSAETKARYKQIAEDDGFKDLMEVYKAPVESEEDRYYPFCQLSNRVITHLFPGVKPKDLPLVIVRNDRINILGSAATRYPDCVGVTSSAMKDPRRGSPAKLAEAGPKELAFGWHEVLTFWEFKMTHTYLGKKVEASLNFDKSGSIPNQSDKLQSSAFNLMETADILPGSKETSRSRRATTKLAKRPPGDSPISPRVSRKKLRSYSRGEATQPATSHQSRIFPSASSHTSDLDNDSASIDEDNNDSDYVPGPTRKKAKQKGRATKDGETQKMTQTRVDYALQCASYGLEMLSHSAPSTHRLGFLIDDDKIPLQYYDRTRCVVSTEESFIDNPLILIAILDCVAHADRNTLGFLEAVTPPSKNLPLTSETANTLYLSASTLSCSNGAILKLKEVLYRHHAIIGRGTCVVRAESDFPAWKGKRLILKISFTPTSRSSEGSYLSKMYDHANKPGNGWVKDHLPNMLHSETLPLETAMATQLRLSKYIASLESALNPNDRIGYEMRNVQILVTTELQSIKKLQTDEGLGMALAGIVKCYKWVYEETGIMHRDISIENLMYHEVGGKIVGVLNDFDLAIHKSQQNNGPLSRQRTGTKPFMAIDLLRDEPYPHLYRHDLESIMYVTVVLACYMLASKEVKDKSKIADWFHSMATSSSIAASKRDFLSGGVKRRPVVTETMRGLSELVTSLFDYFAKMNLAVITAAVTGKEDELDHETLGGVVTMNDFTKLFGIVQPVSN